MRARIFLRQPLFTLPGAGPHVPPAAMVLDATCTPVEGLGLRVEAWAWFDEKGRELTAASAVLILPAAKIDHLQVLDAS